MPLLPIELKTSENLVVAFDICSSTAILEDLILNDNMKNFRSLIMRLNTFLNRCSRTYNFKVYKFIGDGWILIFPIDTVDKNFIKFIYRLCLNYKVLSAKYLTTTVLQEVPDIMGITIGIDKGKLTEFSLNNNEEYIGRPINMACRLQGAISKNYPNPQYKALLSKHTYSFLKEISVLNLSNYKPRKTEVELKNIKGGRNVECFKLEFFRKSDFIL